MNGCKKAAQQNGSREGPDKQAKSRQVQHGNSLDTTEEEYHPPIATV
jgi:hypothetical protein